VHRDRDYLSAEAATAFEERLSNADIHPFLTASNDIECHFINAEHLHQCNPAISLARVEELIAQATAETADRSIIALVNQRTAEAFRNRQAGANVNHGEIAVTAAADYNANPAAYRRGKIVLGRLTALLQQELHANPWIFMPTEHLRSPSLTGIAEQIWGAAA
jgi:hypothetical protein